MQTPPPPITLLIEVEATLADHWRIKTNDDFSLAAIDSFDSRGGVPAVPYSGAELFHGLKEELMGDVPGSPFSIIRMERVHR